MILTKYFYNWNHIVFAFGDCLISFSMMSPSMGEVHPCCNILQNFFLFGFFLGFLSIDISILYTAQVSI